METGFPCRLLNVLQTFVSHQCRDSCQRPISVDIPWLSTEETLGAGALLVTLSAQTGFFPPVLLWRLSLEANWVSTKGNWMSDCPLPAKDNRSMYHAERKGSLCQEATVHSSPRTEPQRPLPPLFPLLTWTLTSSSFCSSPPSSFQARNCQRWAIKSLKPLSQWIFTEPKKRTKKSNIYVI